MIGQKATQTALSTPSRLLRRPQGRCTRIVIQLPHSIIFYGTAGPNAKISGGLKDKGFKQE